MRVHRPHPGPEAWHAPTAEHAVLLLAALLFLEDVARAREQFTRLKSDEQIIFFPTICQRVVG